MKNSVENPRKTGRPLSFDRDVVLKKAMLTFWRYGYETTSISDLTAAMGVTAPSIYTAFGDKKRLFLEAMQLYAGSPEDLERSLGDAETARDAVFTMLISAAEAFTGKDTPRGCLLASATASGSKDSAEVQQAVAQVRHRIANQLRKRIEHDVKVGILPRDTQASTLADLSIALIQGMSVLARDGAQRKALTVMIDMAMSAWPDNANSR